jgi:diguanylate cyclase (GGDEF)-like protein/PAS domain S-box-containing protein
VFIRDITRRKKAEEALRTSEEKYREILDNIDDGYYEVNLAGRFTFFNDVLPRFLDYTHEELLHTNFKTVMDEENAKKVFEAFHVVYLTGVPDRLVEWESTKKDGSKVYVESSVFPVKDAEGKSVGFRGVVRDISERKKFQEKLHAMATTDELTGLCNRRGFITLAEQQLKYAERNKKKSMLAFVDLDGMKQINDIWGHEEGDRALINTANLLKQVFRKSDIIARLGGDEFAVLAADVSETMPDVFLRRLQKLLDTHNSMKDQRYRLSMSVGSTFYEPDNPTSLDEIMSLADKLMYEDKRRKVV